MKETKIKELERKNQALEASLKNELKLKVDAETAIQKLTLEQNQLHKTISEKDLQFKVLQEFTAQEQSS